MDDNFTLRSDRVVEICEGMIGRGYGLRWSAPNGTSAKGATPEMARAMKAAGCRSVCVAIETGSEEFRRSALNKRVSNEEIRSAVHAFRGAGIPVGGLLMLGMPGETDERFRDTVRLVKELPLTWIVVSFTFPHVGTPLFDELLDCGFIDGPNPGHVRYLRRACLRDARFHAGDLGRAEVAAVQGVLRCQGPAHRVGRRDPMAVSGRVLRESLAPGLRSMAGSAAGRARGRR